MATILFLSGCSSAPSQANIELRKQNQDLQETVQTLQTQNAGLQAQVVALQRNWPTTQILPESRLEQLFTCHGLYIGRGTGFLSAQQSANGKATLSVFVVPTDQQGQPLKAAGSFTVELFDLTLPPSKNLLEKWEFPRDAAMTHFLGNFLLYTYVFNCPLQVTP
ncbi:MAG TPA: hypothetical protein VMD30_12240, partial [Tepidisphaeraceae bacterium]|nr:hypothetical protein [Tepidisphaeraceae bacterium]